MSYGVGRIAAYRSATLARTERTMEKDRGRIVHQAKDVGQQPGHAVCG